MGVVLANTVVSLYQEIRAKRMLDRIAVLTRPRATAVRAGVRREVDPSEIVLGDVLELEPGDQIVVDGQMVGRGRMEVDESMLTGESDAVTKISGDPLFSGSFVVNGGGLMEVQKVGMESFAARIAAGAQAFRRVRTPLQEQVNLVIRALLLMVVYFEILVIVKALVEDTAFVETVRMSTVIVALVPNGLILAIALAYALGAVRMAGKGALIQQSNAVESLSHVDVLCTDKTGTLTTNNIKMDELLPLDDGAPPEAAARIGRILGDYAASTMAGNRTTEAFLDAYGGTARTVREEVLFSSARKWSALAFDDPDLPGVYVLGAPEIVAPYLEPADGPDGHAAEWTAAGLRVLLLAHKAVLDGPLNGPDGKAELPEGLQPLALISLRDELRPLARETLEGFSAAGVQLKVISGDNPQTVAALAVQAGFPADLRVVSGKELEGLGQGQLADIADEATIFGRVTPQQKEELVDALRSRGRYVAMVGDGVNDVISLKRANLGIAMQSGSQAARGVADMVLLDDSFGSLPYAFQEGQRIQNGMADILKIFMVRIFSKVLIIASVVAVGGFPFSPRQGSMLSFFTAGLPTLAFAAWARPGAPERGSLMGRLVAVHTAGHAAAEPHGPGRVPALPHPPRERVHAGQPVGHACGGPAVRAASGADRHRHLRGVVRTAHDPLHRAAVEVLDRRLPLARRHAARVAHVGTVRVLRGGAGRAAGPHALRAHRASLLRVPADRGRRRRLGVAHAACLADQAPGPVLRRARAGSVRLGVRPLPAGCGRTARPGIGARRRSGRTRVARVAPRPEADRSAPGLLPVDRSVALRPCCAAWCGGSGERPGRWQQPAAPRRAPRRPLPARSPSGSTRRIRDSSGGREVRVVPPSTVDVVGATVERVAAVPVVVVSPGIVVVVRPAKTGSHAARSASTLNS